jgi:hypothetical protein
MDGVVLSFSVVCANAPTFSPVFCFHSLYVCTGTHCGFKRVCTGPYVGLWWHSQVQDAWLHLSLCCFPFPFALPMMSLMAQLGARCLCCICCIVSHFYLLCPWCFLTFSYVQCVLKPRECCCLAFVSGIWGSVSLNTCRSQMVALCKAYLTFWRMLLLYIEGANLLVSYIFSSFHYHFLLCASGMHFYWPKVWVFAQPLFAPCSQSMYCM